MMAIKITMHRESISIHSSRGLLRSLQSGWHIDGTAFTMSKKSIAPHATTVKAYRVTKMPKGVRKEFHKLARPIPIFSPVESLALTLLRLFGDCRGIEFLGVENGELAVVHSESSRSWCRTNSGRGDNERASSIVYRELRNDQLYVRVR